MANFAEEGEFDVLVERSIVLMALGSVPPLICQVYHAVEVALIVDRWVGAAHTLIAGIIPQLEIFV